MEFCEYRAWFYFFQYQFYMRCAHVKGRLASGRDAGPIAEFLRQLVYNPVEVHDRWETVESYKQSRQPEVSRRKRTGVPSPKKRERQAKLRTPEPGAQPYQSCKAVIRFTKKESIRCRFMLFEFPSTVKLDKSVLLSGKRHIYSLYKSLVIYDLFQSGKTPWSIASTLLKAKDNGQGTLLDAGNRRKKIDGDVWDCLRPFEYLKKSSYNFILEGIGTFADEDLSILFTKKRELYKPELNSQRENLQGEKDGIFECLDSFSNDIRRLKRNADQLIILAASGQFSRFPNVLPST
jgi:hypothetical protein